MLKLYHGTTSVCAAKVRLVLYEKGLSFESELLNLQAGDQHDPAYLKLNPKAVVPTLIDGDRIITKSSVIMFYLEETEPAPALMPDDPWMRAQTRLWMKRVDEFLHPGCTTVTFATANRKHFLATMTPEEREARYARNPNPERREIQRDCIEMGLDAPRVGAAVRQYDAAFDDMERQLSEKPWLGGRDFGFADICMIPYVNRLSLICMDSLWTRNRPNVSDWFDRVQARPSYEDAIVKWTTEDDHDRFVVPRGEVEGKLWEVLAV